MATVPSIKVVKSMPFKGGTRLWSNRYHFNGGTPSSDSHWHTLMDNVVTAEKAVLNSSITIVECLGYAAGSEVPVSTKTYSTAGTLSGSGSPTFSTGETAALVRYSTAARTTKNHPIYCFNYYHSPVINGVTLSTVDQVNAAQKSALETYAGSWISGFSDSALTLVRASPNGAAATGHVTEEYTTHRDFPYSPSI